jgi:formylglycine-generating enzyme required for sulfatase activity
MCAVAPCTGLRRSAISGAVIVGLALAAASGCASGSGGGQSGSGGGGAATGGSPSGGQTGAGGGFGGSGATAGSGTGGTVSTGGTGGSVSTGGTIGTGGSISTGGLSGTGGSGTGGSGGGAGTGQGGASVGGSTGGQAATGAGGQAGTLGEGGGGGAANGGAGTDGGGGSIGAFACKPSMVPIPAKNMSFLMGFTASQAPGNSGGPWACFVGQHQVTFTYDYCMDAKMVTQTDFSTVMGFNPSKHQISGSALPVDSESWYDAMLYCNTKSTMEGLEPAYTYGAITYNGKSANSVANVAVDLTKNGYRLPTNAEYEYAERANTVGLYFFSPTQTSNITGLGAVYAWYAGNTGNMTTEPAAVYSGPNGSQPVGTKKPNPWGLYDIVGNLFEWENDWEGPYATTSEVDPTGPATGTEAKPASQCGTFGVGPNQKMAKGGSWHTDVSTHMHISYHFKWAPAVVHPELGFRCVATAAN